MSYTSNPYVGKTRRDAVNDVRTNRKTQAEAARFYGVHRVTIYRWLKRTPKHNRQFIDTLPSRPKHHPNQLKQETITRVIELRNELKRCTPIIHAHLNKEGIAISLSSVARTLRRHHLLRKRKQLQRPYAKILRPPSDRIGSLVEVDTIHFLKANGFRSFIYVAIDTYSRLGYAEHQRKLSTKTTLSFFRRLIETFKFNIEVVQTDNGSEFGESLAFFLQRRGIRLRHSRVRKPNDNAHVERFIRTIQEEGFKNIIPANENKIRKRLREFISFYNNERLHLSLDCQTPSQYVAKVLN